MLDTLRIFHSLGLQDAEVFYAREHTTIYEYAGGALKVKNIGFDEGFGIRILKDRKLGFSYSNSKEGVQKAVRSAISLSRFSQPSGFSFAPEQKYPKAEVYDERVAEADEKELKGMVDEIASGIKKYSEPVRIVIAVQKGGCAIANTNLLFARENSTSFSAYAEAKNKDGFGVADYSNYKMLEHPRELGEKAGRMAKEMRNPKKLPSGKYSVVFAPSELSALCELLLSSFSGELKRRKVTKLWDKEGKKVFSDKLTMWDDPFAEAASKSAFDGEGVASRKMPLIERGVVRNFLYSREAAALEHVKKEGNCSRIGYDAPPKLGASNVVIGTGNSAVNSSLARSRRSRRNVGDDEPETELSELRKYVYIASMHGLHTANPLTGDFGAEVSIAFLHENGKITPARGFMVSENIFNLFSKIEYVGKKTMQSGSFISPKIGFRDISLIS